MIRPEAPADIPSIAALTASAFLTAAHTSHTEQYIVTALRKAGALTMSLVAELDGVVVGHVAVSPVTISDGSAGWHGLGPISVAPAQQRLGIGSQLTQAALAALRDRGAAGCVLLGDPGYYGRFGFKAEPGLILPDIPPAYFQAVSFSADPLPQGRVDYHPAFNSSA